MYKFIHNKALFANAEQTAETAAQDLKQGLEVLNTINQPLISIFGSHITLPSDPLYEHVRSLAKQLGESGYGVVTGGGPGLMEAANAGAMDAKVASVGIKEAMLSREQVSADVHTHRIDCEYMFIRRFLLAIKSEGLVFLPGGFGTLNELFEFLVLIQIELSDKVPVILYDSEYWSGLKDWIEAQLLVRTKLIDSSDMQLFTIVDSIDEVLLALRQ